MMPAVSAVAACCSQIVSGPYRRHDMHYIIVDGYGGMTILYNLKLFRTRNSTDPAFG
ncbi:MAG: hypothetical protein IPK83_16580 [Planctomycetes bacterium]|nr:hypothetical protein [Planctomycetota bacterium]